MLRPRLWVSLVPYGIGRTKPNHYLEILRTVWDNRHDLPYAWRCPLPPRENWLTVPIRAGEMSFH